jgi:hypothetical protein
MFIIIDTCRKRVFIASYYHPPSFLSTEEGYRNYYNILRLAESKAYSTPIFLGELFALRKESLLKINGFPTDIGSDNSHTATEIASIGYRSNYPTKF